MDFERGLHSQIVQQARNPEKGTSGGTSLSAYFLGIDLGGTSVKAIAANDLGEKLREWHLPYDMRQPGSFAQTIRGLVRSMPSQMGTTPEGIGISAPGLADRSGRSIAFMPGRFDGLEGLDWTDFLGSPTVIPLLNDAHAALLGEVWKGAARGCEHVILLTLGTGVGGAVLAEGRLLRGHLGRAGHLGHTSLNPDGPQDITGTPGSLEDAIGNNNIFARSNGRYRTTHDLISAHLKGDEFATQVWLKSVKALAAAIASFINVLDPEAVVLGGGVALSGEALLGPLKGFLNKFEWRPGGRCADIRLAALGEWAGAYGAARMSLNSRRS